MKETIAIVGAGPYGLAAAAHLRDLPNTEIRVFGQPMSFWQNYMPQGMLLRSGWRASYIADPRGSYTLEAYQAATGDTVSTPVPLDKFLAYGRWFQQQVAPDVDQRKVERIDGTAKNFSLALQGGEIVQASRVIVATGIAQFSWRPPEFANLPVRLTSHSSEHTDFRRFSGHRVAVIGGGQSALESAALLREAGAQVEVFVRERHVYFLGWRQRLGYLGVASKLLYSWTDVGPAGLSQLVSHPNHFRVLPRSLQDPIARRCIRPAGAGWLRPRLAGIPIHLGQTIRSATPTEARLKLQIDDGSERIVDHLLMSTGYRINIERYGFLAPELRSRVQQSDGYPILGNGFESSVAGLHFLGAPAAWSYGPLMRFVAGASFACRTLVDSVQNT